LISGSLVTALATGENARGQPQQQRPRIGSGGLEARQGDQPAALDHVGNELGAIGGDADEPLAGLALPFGQVAAEFLLGGAALPPQVPLELEHRLAQQGVEPAVDLGQGLLEGDLGGAGAETIDEYLIHQCPGLLVARTADQLVNDFGQATG